MARKVLKSLHNVTADRCVDLFVRDDGTFGYEEYRRDHEDGGGWYPLNLFSHQVFESQDHALAKARMTVQWLITLE